MLLQRHALISERLSMIVFGFYHCNNGSERIRSIAFALKPKKGCVFGAGSNVSDKS